MVASFEQERQHRLEFWQQLLAAPNPEVRSFCVRERHGCWSPSYPETQRNNPKGGYHCHSGRLAGQSLCRQSRNTGGEERSHPKTVRHQGHERMWPQLPRPQKDRVGLIRCVSGRVPRVSQASLARRRPEPIRGRPVSWASERPWVSVFVQFFRFIDQLGCDLGTLGLPLSQWDTPGLQDRFLFRTCGYHQIIMNALSHLKRFHTVTF